MEKIYLLIHVSFDYYTFSNVYAVSKEKNKLYEQAKKDDNTLVVYELNLEFDKIKEKIRDDFLPLSL